MYYQYFGLTEAPFSIAVNPRYLFMSARHRDALAHLLYGVGTGGGFILLTGEVGTGKTTINRCLLAQMPPDTDVAIILNPALNAMELLASACDELNIVYDHDRHTLKTLTDNLHSFLLKNHSRGRKTVLLIDEAQHLDFDVLEQIRLLTNLETNSEKLLQIILIGQPELAQMLAQPELRQLNQRITARFNLDPLNIDETGAYIHHRLQVAGMSPERVIFPPSVVRGIYKASRGIPRVINVLCDRMLLGAYGRNKSTVDHTMLNLATQEVLGGQAVTTPIWRWLGIAVVVLLSVWAGGWLLGKYVGGAAIVAIEEPAEITQVMPEAIESTDLIQEQAKESVVLPSAEPMSAVTVDPELSPAPLGVEAVMQLPGQAMVMLWALNSVVPAPQMLCSTSVQNGLACVEGEAWTWDEVDAINTPLVLEMITPQRFSAEVLLLGIEEPNAWVSTDKGVTAISLAELAPYWTGRYQFLWHAPAGFKEPLGLGDVSPVVAEVAQLFARLDAQESPLSEKYFNGALQQRVRMFQQQNELIADGVVGIQTLLKLNEQLGIDMTAAQARKQQENAMERLDQ